MATNSIPIWKEAPFIRLLLPLTAGILVEWYIGLPAIVYGIVLLLCTIVLTWFGYARFVNRYRYYGVAGLAIQLLFVNLGGLAAYCKDVRHQPGYAAPANEYPAICIATITAPLKDKGIFLQATASICFLQNSLCRKAGADVIIYFKKDSLAATVSRLSRVAFRKSFQPIADNGNPGGFNYRRYWAFQGIDRQVYLKQGEYLLLSPEAGNPVNNFLCGVREKVVHVLSRYIPGKKEAGLAEALLVGYKDDLDKMLVRAYANTGVVHIIAISGLHLALVYWLLSLACRPLGRGRAARYIKPVVIICGLWLFSIVAGSSPSVLRSAVMFSFIVAGDTFRRRSTIYNSLAGSAFLLLCYNPYWLWDAGFQLSYLAVAGIVAFMRPVYGWIFVQNKMLDGIWKGCAISIAAQLLTTPVSLGLFHQFPNYFLVTNVLAVPLSSLIVLLEIALCAFSPIPLLAKGTGYMILQLIRVMNGYVEHIGQLPFSVTGGLQFSVMEIMLCYVVIIAAGCWLLQKNKMFSLVCLCAAVCFCLLQFISRLQVNAQRKLVVYNVSKHRAIDLLLGGDYIFMGDTALQHNDALQSFYLLPSRIFFQCKPLPAYPAISLEGTGSMLQVSGKRIVLVNEPVTLAAGALPLTADCIIVTGNPNLRIPELVRAFRCRQLVFDSSNTLWKINTWKAACAQYGIACHAVAEKGAFILNLN